MERSTRFWLIALAGALGLTAACYFHVVGFGLTDKDTLLHITEARVEGAGDLVGMLTKPLTGGRAPLDANFYRPTVMLSYAGLRAAFGWNAIGYHIFDLALHALNGCLLALFAARCAARSGLAKPRRFGVLCGAIFLVHPVGVEVVPAIARNGDLLVTALMLGALLALDGALEARAAGAREARAAGTRDRGRLAAFYGLFALTLGAKEPGIVSLGVAFLYIALVRRDRVVTALAVIAPCTVIAAIYLAVRARVLDEVLGGYGLEFSLGSMALSVASALSLDLTFPGYAHRFEGPLPGLRVGAVLLVCIAIAFALTVRTDRAFREILDAPASRLLVFALAACAGFAALFVATQTYDRRLLYPVVAFWCFVPALAVHGSWGLWRRSRPLGATALAGVVGVGALFLWQSPLLHRYEEWRNSGHVAWAVTERIRNQWRRLPDDANVFVFNLPSSFGLDPMRRVTGADISSTNALAPNAIRAWLQDQFPEKNIYVAALGFHVYRERMAEFLHGANIEQGWLVYRQPTGSNDLDEALEELPRFKKVSVLRRIVRLAYTARPIPDNLWVLIVDGTRPVLIPANRLDGVPRSPASDRPSDTPAPPDPR
jgi:hypothetical protein